MLAWTDVRQESKYAHDLKQLDNGVKVPPSGHKCARCDMDQNLWLNLTDGAIMCGRKNFDGMVFWGCASMRKMTSFCSV